MTKTIYVVWRIWTLYNEDGSVNYESKNTPLVAFKSIEQAAKFIEDNTKARQRHYAVMADGKVLCTSGADQTKGKLGVNSYTIGTLQYEG